MVVGKAVDLELCMLVINRIEIKNHEKEFNIILHIVSRPLPGIFL